MHPYQWLPVIGIFCLCLANISNASPIRQSSDVNHLQPWNESYHKRWNTPYQPSGGWMAMGDSFSAGPGAGDRYDSDSHCKRGQGAYPPVLNDNWPNRFVHSFQFESCTGDKIPDAISRQLPQVNGLIYTVTLSIGGNDIGFSKILLACIAGLTGDCDDLISQARDKLYSPDLWDQFSTLIRGIVDQSGWRRAGGKRPLIYQTSYPAFFDAYTDQCDGVSFGPFPLPPPTRPPLLTKDLRGKLNILSAEMNNMIAFWLADINAQYYDDVSVVIYADQDELYTGHRFCREGVQEPDFNNPDTWFFPMKIIPGPPAAQSYAGIDIATCEAAAGDSIGDLWVCYMAQQLQTNPNLFVNDPEAPRVLPELWAKIFHPTIDGHAGVVTALKSKMSFTFDSPKSKSLRILCVGDGITWGVGSSRQSGYRRFLDELLKAPGNRVFWRGTQVSGDPPYDRNEGYPGKKIDEIHKALSHSGALPQRPNIILLMAGSEDMTDPTGDYDGAPGRLSSMIDMLLDACPDAIVLVGLLPPLGPPQIKPYSEVQRRVMTYNAAVSNLVNERQAQGQKITKVHTTVDFFSRGANYFEPNDRGYEKMAHDWFEQIQEVDRRGWITDPVPPETAEDVDLRILPLGDSITYGTSSSDGNGYRLDLQNLLLPGLTSANKTLQYIGSVRSGSMDDNDNEGHPGYTIDQIGGQAKNSLPDRPNVVLLMAGTNDIVQNLDLVDAPARLSNLIDLVVDAVPDAAVLVATLTPLRDAAREAGVQNYNAAIPGVIASRANAGKKVMLVSMSAVSESNISPDGIHPNDSGYVLMAQAWYNGIEDARSLGWIVKPVGGAQHACSGQWQSTRTIAYGVGSDDGPFVQSWTSAPGIAYGISNTHADTFPIGVYGAFSHIIGSIFPPNGGGFTQNWVETGVIAYGVGAGDGVFFGDIDGDGMDDYLYVSETGQVTAYKNTGGYPTWKELGIIAYGVGANRSQIRFGDVDCDGYVDYLVINDDGSVSAWLNLGPSHWPNWGSKERLVAAQPQMGAGANWHFADVNGDKCVDYLLVNPDTGTVHALLNDHAFGYGVKGDGVIALGVGAPGSAVTFADINGDGLSDYLVVDSNTGAVTAWFNLGYDNWPSWSAQGEIASGVLTPGHRVMFANLNPTSYHDLKADYLTVNDATGAVSAWMNHGYGDTDGDGVRFADIDGDGADDYLWVSQNGAVRAFLNTGAFPTWHDLGTIATGVGVRDNIIFADVNCDGMADYLVVDPTTGSVNAWLNLGVASFPNWDGPIEIAYGVGTPGSWVRFGDIDGDGCDDYMTLNPDTGAMYAWLNTGDFPRWTALGLIATGVGEPGTKVRLADVTGNGRVDYLVVEENGSGIMYTNARQVSSGLVPRWGQSPVSLAWGVGAFRENLRFADVTGDGKSDYLIVNPQTGAVDAYNNNGTGGKLQGGDGVRFADVTGDGSADYLWLEGDGAVHLYTNLGSSSWPIWGDNGVIAYGVGAPRERVLFADLNCDGLADYLVIGELGLITAYYNLGASQWPTWRKEGPFSIVAAPTPWESIRFADVNGDKCDDFLIVKENGFVTAYLNAGGDSPAFGSPIDIAYGVGAQRVDIRFADYDGDGKADYLVVNRVNGAVHAYINLGQSSWPIWKDGGEIALGTGCNGLTVAFADINGDKLADYLTIDPQTAAVVASVNDCRR